MPYQKTRQKSKAKNGADKKEVNELYRGKDLFFIGHLLLMYNSNNNSQLK
jgi:hypothetical protein